MKALSLWRPWSWAVLHADKRVENRSWVPPYALLGTWVAIHAAQRWDSGGFQDMRAGEFGPLARCVPDEIPTGIVGAARITNVMLAMYVHSVWAFGPWCWRLDDVVVLPKPIPCKGRQGLWDVPIEFDSQIRKTIKRC